MAKKNTNAQAFTQEQQAIIADIVAQAVAQALAAQAPTIAKQGKGKTAPQPKAEKVEFIKKDGTKVLCTKAQADAWEAYRSREHKSLDEVKALTPEISDAGRAYVKAHPGCTRKEAAANGCKNITKDGLKALKRELGVR